MNGLPVRTSLRYENGIVRFIDQRQLPGKIVVVVTERWQVIEKAIKSLAIRGAPLIGVAAAWGVVLAAREATEGRSKGGVEFVQKVIARLRLARPTAVNLFAALDRMVTALLNNENEYFDALLGEATRIQQEDEASCLRISETGLPFIPKKARVLTICNTGFLATAGIGTALGVIHKAYDAGLIEEVLVPETRPLLQGARLTMWELVQSGIPARLLPDGAIGSALRKGVDLAIIGADRITVNGDTANKIGSLQEALACKRFGVPFYVAAPFSTIDPNTPSGDRIAIEERATSEVTSIRGKRIAPESAPVYNPAFDVVEGDLIAGFFTDRGHFKPPYHFDNELVGKGRTK